ncbi:MAG: CotH kinase family protein [Bacteroidetes bacterium]|nr:CotH kinase family protein [Bacteroidota bacterium]
MKSPVKYIVYGAIIFILLVLAVPAFVVIRYIQHDPPLREYVKKKVLNTLRNDLDDFFNFSKISTDIPELLVLNLLIPPEGVSALEAQIQKRFGDLATGKVPLLGTGQWKYVPAQITHDGTVHDIKIRIRGDMPSNYNKGLLKASYRFNISSATSLLGMKRCSLVRPEQENDFYGFLVYKFFDLEGLVSNDFHFIRIQFNGKDNGIYVLQEAFAKELVESADLREGLLMRFENDCIDNNGAYNPAGFPILEAYQEKRVLRNSSLAPLYNRALNKFEMVKTGAIKVSDAFDIDKFAQFVAIGDIFLAHHALKCQNVKLYFNPITDKFEPILWDPTSYVRYKIELPVEQGHNGLWADYFDDLTYYPIYTLLAMDEDFLEAYTRQLQEYVYNDKVPNFISQYQGFISAYQPELMRQGYRASFNRKRILHHLASLRSLYTVDDRVIASLYKNEDLLRVISRFPLPLWLSHVEIEGVTINIEKILLPNSQNDFTITDSILQSTTKRKFKVYTSFLHERRESSRKKGKIFERLDKIEEMTSREAGGNEEYLTIDEEMKTITFDQGLLVIDENLELPKGYVIMINTGTEIVLRNNASILSESPIKAIGFVEDSILIRSEGGGGIFLNRAEGKSEFQYVIFDGLSSPVKGNWTITGAVTFHESPVTITGCVFKNNQSEDALNIIRCEFSMDNSLFHNISSDALDVDFGKGEIINCTLSQIMNDGLDFSGSTIKLSNIILENINDKAISCGERSNLNASDINISHSFIGLTCKDLSNVEVNNLQITNTLYPITAYQKKDAFGPSSITITNFSVEAPRSGEVQFLVEKGSVLRIDDKLITGDLTDVLGMLGNFKLEREKVAEN